MAEFDLMLTDSSHAKLDYIRRRLRVDDKRRDEERPKPQPADPAPQPQPQDEPQNPPPTTPGVPEGPGR